MPVPAYAQSSLVLGRLALPVTGSVRAAGQSSPALSQEELDAALGTPGGAYTFSTSEAGLPGVDRTPTYGQGATYTYDANGNAVLQGLTPQQASTLLSSIGTAEVTAGNAIASIIRSGDALSRQTLESAALTRIQQLQTQLAGANAAGNAVAAQRATAGLATLQQALDQLRAQNASNLANYAWGIGAVIVALGVGGYFVLRKPKKSKKSVRRNPSCGCSRAGVRSNPCRCRHAR